MIDEAKKTTPLPIQVVEQAGKQFIQAAPFNSSAWNVSLEFIAYRTSFNKPDLSAASQPMPVEEQTHYTRGADIPGKPAPRAQWLSPIVPETEGALYDPIGKDENAGMKKGTPAFLRMIGGATALDGEQIRNVIFDGVEIHYSGALVILNNVVFINCTFVLDNNEEARKLGLLMLASSRIDFTGA